MATLYLIDGYNLLHAMGVLQGRVGPLGLEKARLRLLGLLHGTFGEESSSVTVVFDAAGARPGAVEHYDYQGIQVRFAVHQQEADDLIELLIRHDSSPRHLIVVSDDHRIQQAARRRQCTVQGCLEFLDGLERRRRQSRGRVPEATEKREGLSQEDVQDWLKEFAGLEDEPGLKELFDPYGFNEDQ